MTYIKVATGIWVGYNETTQTSVVIKKDEILKEIAFLKEQYDALPAPVTNTEYLAWGKLNYPSSGQEQSRILLKTRYDELMALKEELK